MIDTGMIRWHWALIMLCVVVGLACGLSFERQAAHGAELDGPYSVTFRQGLAGYAGCVDTRLSEENPNQNFGNQELILGMKGRISSLLRFDVSTLPAGATVIEADLSVAVVNYGQRSTEPSVIGVFPVTRTWEEMQATWFKATNIDNWGTSGCNNVANDRSPTSLDNQPVYHTGWYTWNVTSAVQRWLQDPPSNKGMMLRQLNTAVGGEYDVRQSEYAGLEWRPLLVVTYTLSTPTPTAQGTPIPLPCLGTPEPGSVITVLQQGANYQGVQDTFLSFDERETRFSDAWYIHVGYKRKDSGLIRFNLSGIPTGSRVVCAALSLFAERWSGGEMDVGAYLVKRSNLPNVATWTWADSQTPWQLGGCNGGDDRAQMPTSSVTIHNILTRYHWDLTQIVDDWVNGRVPNLGVSLQPLGELNTNTVWFTSSDDGVVVNRPLLVVVYVPPAASQPTCTPTATPTSLPSANRSVTFQEGLAGYDAAHDARISAESPNANWGHAELKVGARQRVSSLISFDLSSIPTNATVVSATLSAYVYEREGSASLGIDIFAVARAWSESETTWDRATASERWGLPGGNHTLSDRASAPSASTTITGLGWYSWSVRDNVQHMVNQMSSNHGWLVRQSLELPGVISLRSSEYGMAAWRPKLVVVYYLP